jgi:hypothetical protein
MYHNVHSSYRVVLPRYPVPVTVPAVGTVFKCSKKNPKNKMRGAEVVLDSDKTITAFSFLYHIIFVIL